MTHTVCTSEGCTQWVFGEDATCGKCTKHNHIVHLVGDIAHADMKVSEEMIVDEIAQVLTRESVRLTDQEIRDICTIYHESHGLDAKSLEESNQLYMGLDHANNMVLI